MSQKSFNIVLLGAALTLPFVFAQSASAATYWVVVDPTTHQCSIVQQDQKPSGVKVVGNGYSNQEDAQATTQRATACGGVH